MRNLVAALFLLPVMAIGGGSLSNDLSGSRASGHGFRPENRRMTSASRNDALTFEQRVAAQTAIERVFYEKRIWPKENKTPKPPFEQMVPKDLIEKKVNESLLKSAAMEKFWQRSITPEVLQAELDRMAKGTQDAQTLHDLFQALGNDPRLIAETLARETLSDRLVRSWYAWDTRFHAEARARAEGIAARAAAQDWKSLGGESDSPEGSLRRDHKEDTKTSQYYRHTYVLDEYGEQTPSTPGTEPNITRVNAEEFSAQRKKYSTENSNPARCAMLDPRCSYSEPPTPSIQSPTSHAIESADRFTLTRTLSITDSKIEIETISVFKTSFGQWWGNVLAGSAAAAAKNGAETASFPYRLPGISTATSCDQWQSAPGMNNTPPDARDGHSAVWTGTEIIVWGGYIGGYTNTGGRYTPATDSWYPTSGGTNVPVARHLHTAVWTGTEMIIWGGADSSSADLNSGGKYDPITDLWNTTSTGINAPSTRAGHTAIWTGTEMIIWGGADSFAGYLNSGGRYSPGTDSWLPTSIGVNVPQARNFHSAIWTGNEMIVWGGLNQPQSLNTGGRYNPLNDSWMTTSTGINTPGGRTAHGAVWTGSEMIIWGGRLCPNFPCGNNYYNTGGRYNPGTDSWITTSTGINVPSARTVQGAIWTGAEMIIWGGQGSGSVKLNSGGRYNPNTDSWVATSTGLNVPSVRAGHSATWTGSEMIVWGGFATSELLTGGRYNPASDSWLPTSTGVNVPSPRAYHTATWTGAEMIIWGGYDGSSFFNTGGRYNPTTDNWTLTSIGMNVPSARYLPTAVWTGNEMIIWGGNGSSGVVNTGGRYNPTSDSWLPMALDTNTPAIRFAHTAVWTGNEMIIWGGYTSGNAVLNTGGRYSPFSDAWLQTSSVNAPVARVGHSSVWTGNAMIIWGGYNTWPYGLSTGGRYVPVSDNWSPTALSFAPEDRSSHTAIWSGDKMIIWGGLRYTSQYEYLNTGGIYDYINDSWTITTTGMNTPSGRRYHTGTFNNIEMIVWGGTGGTTNTATSTGARYYYSSDIWRTISMDSFTPSERYYHSAIWTGNKMIIWGGSGTGDAFYYNTGGIYSSGAAASPVNSLHGKKSSSINLNWSTVYGAGSYNVKRCNPGGTGCLPGTVISTPTINQYSEPDDGLSHFYAVEAVNQCGATP